MQNGYVIGQIGDSDGAMHLRADAKVLVTAIQVPVCQFGSASYEAKQQAGMTADLSWKDPAAEWEQELFCVFLYSHASCCLNTYLEMRKWRPTSTHPVIKMLYVQA